MQGNSTVSAGIGGVELGFTKPWDCIMTIGLSIIGLESTVSLIGHINLWVRLTGKPSAGNLHAGFDEAGAGNVAMVEIVNPTGDRKSPFGNPSPKVCAPVLDLTDEGTLEIEYG